MSLIDVHMIVYDEPQWQVDRMLESLSKEPVNVHIVQGVAEYPPVIGRGKGFSMGSAPYVSYVDPDDEIIPGCFHLLEEKMKAGHEAAYGFEEVLCPNGESIVCFIPHHAVVVPRGRGYDGSYMDKFEVLFDMRNVGVVEKPIYVWDDRRQRWRQ